MKRQVSRRKHRSHAGFRGAEKRGAARGLGCHRSCEHPPCSGAGGRRRSVQGVSAALLGSAVRGQPVVELAPSPLPEPMEARLRPYCPAECRGPYCPAECRGEGARCAGPGCAPGARAQPPVGGSARPRGCRQCPRRSRQAEGPEAVSSGCLCAGLAVFPTSPPPPSPSFNEPSKCSRCAESTE